MNYLLLSLKKSIVLVFIFTMFISGAQSVATYDFTFTSVWNAEDHGALPAGPHWSDLVGTTHNSNVRFWQIGQMATTGIKDVAEEGNNTVFKMEVNAATNASNADKYLEESFSPFAAISRATLTDVEVNEEKPLLTLVSMIAPSPDWFIGIDSFSLLDNEGNWKGDDTIVIDMFALDAGTDGGTSYEADNSVNIPALLISNIGTQYGFNGQKIGTLTITLTSVILSVEDEISQKNKMKLYPNPTSENLTITNLDKNKVEKIEIYTIVGEKVLDKTILAAQENNLQINLSNLKSGMYFIKLKSLNKTATQKIIIN